ncbi:MAG: hypothetical protein KDK08_28010 [Rhizobiaceae bacterium]|nr:hypothetical protein [Rhizobiaceae bacterium]
MTLRQKLFDVAWESFFGSVARSAGHRRFLADLTMCFERAENPREVEIKLRYLAADYELSTPKEEATS